MAKNKKGRELFVLQVVLRITKFSCSQIECDDADLHPPSGKVWEIGELVFGSWCVFDHL